MSTPVKAGLLTLLTLAVAAATVLATVQGAVQAVSWACDVMGAQWVALAGAFFAGGALVHAAHRAVAARRRRADASL